MKYYLEDLATGAVVILAFGFIAFLFVALFWSIFFPAPSFSLTKADWDCTKSHKQLSTTFTVVNKTMIPITTYTTECDQWTRKGIK